MRDIDRAEGRLLMKHIFYASALLASPRIETNHIPTAATDSVKIYWNPAFFAKLKVDGIIFVLAHEVLHILLKHRLRMGTRLPRMWNHACDYVINRLLIEGKVGKMPEGKEAGLYDRRFDGMSEEKIYEILKREQEQKGNSGDMPGPGCGFGEGDDLLPLPDEMDADAKATLSAQIDQKLMTAANMARLVGKLPGEMEKIIEDLLNPAVPWQDLLRDYMTRKVHDEEDWGKRNRRFQHVYLPARHNERMAGMTVVCDSSGSIGPDDYAKILTEVKAIIEDVNPEFIRVVWADAVVQSEEMIEPDDVGAAIRLNPKGGGGTDMRVPLEHVVQHEPPVVVLITDGYTPWPEVEPPYPLIVVCTTSAACPVGEVVRVL